MSPNTTKETWDAYREKELATVTPILTDLDYELEKEQPHILGERYLMQAVTTTSGKKLILLGRKKVSNERVVIKITDDPAGMRELERERVCRRVLTQINFAYQVFHTPEELFFGMRSGHLISIQRFIEQESTFLARPLTEQFALALTSFKAQEGAHATTYEHARLIEKTFSTMDAAAYVATFEGFRENILRETSSRTALSALLEEASVQLAEGTEVIEQYCGFLTHTDFVPHNIRIKDGEIYLLDHSSLRFGNKYEGWARFINFMTLYNPPLADALVDYVRLNRTSEETRALKLMRVYRLGEIIWYYTNALKKSSGNLRTLNEERVHFWTTILAAVLHDETIPSHVVDTYRKTRDSLRSDEEKLRQKDLH